jgi:hypothetical protein
MTEQLALQYDDLDAHEARVLCILRAHRGRVAAIRVPDLARQVGYSGRECQAVVHRLRIEHGAPIASAAGKPCGYFLVETAAEVEAFIQEQRRKALGTLAAIAAVKRVALPELLGQLAIEVAS